MCLLQYGVDKPDVRFDMKVCEWRGGAEPMVMKWGYSLWMAAPQIVDTTRAWGRSSVAYMRDADFVGAINIKYATFARVGQARVL